MFIFLKKEFVINKWMKTNKISLKDCNIIVTRATDERKSIIYKPVTYYPRLL